MLLALSLIASACGAPSPSATPTPAPSPTPAATPVPTLDAQVADIQYAFLSNVNDLTSDVEGLAMSSCADIATTVRANPTEVSDVHGFAASVQRVGSSQPALDNDDVRSALADLSNAMQQLDAALAACGISTP
jgi:hypothetical protein